MRIDECHLQDEMSLTLSRRGLFRGLAPAPDVSDGAEPQRQVAVIGAACVEPKGVSCRRCGEACEADAIHFRPIGRGVTAAQLDAELCTGCGECLPVCPVSAISLVAADRLALVQGLVHSGEQA